MSYAQVSDLIARVGLVDAVRLTTGAGAPEGVVDAAIATTALTDASAMIDSYLRRRYATPLGQNGQPVPTEIVRVCVSLAVYDLAARDGRARGEDITNDYKICMTWLRDVSDGRVYLDVLEAPSGAESFAAVSTREPVYGGCDNSTASFGVY